MLKNGNAEMLKAEMSVAHIGIAANPPSFSFSRPFHTRHPSSALSVSRFAC